ncbi:MAG TPA: FHA domain-containing protein [Polyangiaceae bacterium]|nr:FHA domain-containing protein [Polyangiaceae bacterium]
MSTLLFEIAHEDGRRETAPVEGMRALVGSASHCDVRLPMGDAADEHLLVELVGDTLRVRTLTDAVATTLDGAPVHTAVLPEGAVLGVGRSRLAVRALSERPETARSSAKRGSNPTQLVAVALLAVLGVAVLVVGLRPESAIAPAPDKAPELFAETPPSCPKDRDTGALAFAEEQADMAVATHERVPFAAHEGVVAVGLYETAAACFRLAGATERAGDAEQAAEALKGELGDDFRARRLRLSHVLALEDYALAKVDVAALRALTAGKQGPYVEWLAKVSKQLRAKEER